jgi:ribosome-associated protein
VILSIYCSKHAEERKTRSEGTVITSTRKNASSPSAEQTLALIEQSLDDDQAIDVKVIPLAGKSSIADHMVIASGTSTRRVGAMTEHILEKLKKAGLSGLTAEGRAANDWVLIDAGDVVVHLFRPEVRAYYDLEKLWEAEISEHSGELHAMA